MGNWEVLFVKRVALVMIVVLMYYNLQLYASVLRTATEMYYVITYMHSDCDSFLL